METWLKSQADNARVYAWNDRFSQGDQPREREKEVVSWYVKRQNVKTMVPYLGKRMELSTSLGLCLK